MVWNFEASNLTIDKNYLRRLLDRSSWHKPDFVCDEMYISFFSHCVILITTPHHVHVVNNNNTLTTMAIGILNDAALIMDLSPVPEFT